MYSVIDVIYCLYSIQAECVEENSVNAQTKTMYSELFPTRDDVVWNIMDFVPMSSGLGSWSGSVGNF